MVCQGELKKDICEKLGWAQSTHDNCITDINNALEIKGKSPIEKRRNLIAKCCHIVRELVTDLEAVERWDFIRDEELRKLEEEKSKPEEPEPETSAQETVKQAISVIIDNVLIGTSFRFGREEDVNVEELEKESEILRSELQESNNRIVELEERKNNIQRLLEEKLQEKDRELDEREKIASEELQREQERNEALKKEIEELKQKAEHKEPDITETFEPPPKDAIDNYTKNAIENDLTKDLGHNRRNLIISTGSSLVVLSVGLFLNSRGILPSDLTIQVICLCSGPFLGFMIPYWILLVFFPNRE